MRLTSKITSHFFRKNEELGGMIAPNLVRNILKALDIKYLSRRSRWGAEYEKTFTPLPFTHIPEGMGVDEFEILIRIL